ncbi:YheU family protein [Sansalvadorimonas sp. 2012CJ34-2]|uniref:YheU family protein n=1 Tax=Parendozoicomonas callyspongiae TaxID=2942213 RepID=A0ABT0PJT0_9GAMM|nr:YheU family protein [Sansalvadorimonas sp. 2012CJ34-2]MCL6271645.1 YheU family protein [Sansalvadorimonas sp. 2012CJ34-2]
MIVPWQQLEEATLHNLITEFVSRDGTDNGDNTPVTTRINQVLEQLRNGSAVVVWDEMTETANIVPADNIGIA